MKKWFVILVVLAGVALAFNRFPDWKPKKTEPTQGRTTTAVVEHRSIHFAVTAAGDIGPAEQVSVRPEVNGMIATLPVDLGDLVKKDHILLTLDDRDLQTERSTRKAEIDGARINLEKASRDFKRSEELFQARLISQELSDDTKTAFDLAKNSLARAEQGLALVDYRLSKTKILAPFDCTVLTRPVSVGQAVSGSGGFNSGTEVLTIADLTHMIVNAHVNQADVTRLSTGQEVTVDVESVPGLSMKGTVERIAPQSAVKNGVKGYSARVQLKNIDPRVRPGMTANISVPVASAENAVAIPLAAVFTEKGERYVLVKKSPESEEFERREVQIGIADYEHAEVLKGLTPGEIVSLVDTLSKTEKKRDNEAAAATNSTRTVAGGAASAKVGTEKVRQ